MVALDARTLRAAALRPLERSADAAIVIEIESRLRPPFAANSRSSFSALRHASSAFARRPIRASVSPSLAANSGTGAVAAARR
jgi:hypothetical protein